MKSFFLPLLIAVLFFTSCSQEYISTERSIEADIQIRTDYDCIQNATCDVDYDFPVKGPGSYNCFSVTFDNSLTLGEIYCLKQAYFKCFPQLRLTILQPTDSYLEMWCLPVGKPLNSLSTTMDDDPRVDDGG